MFYNYRKVFPPKGFIIVISLLEKNRLREKYNHPRRTIYNPPSQKHKHSRGYKNNPNWVNKIGRQLEEPKCATKKTGIRILTTGQQQAEDSNRTNDPSDHQKIQESVWGFEGSEQQIGFYGSEEVKDGADDG